MMKFKVYKQLDGMDCGPTCLRMVSSHYGRNYSLNKLRELTGFNREGVSMLGLSETAEKIGFRTTGAKLTIGQLKDIQFPAILHWNQNHFVVLYKIKQSVFYIADPARGLMSYSVKEFLDYWLSGNEVGNRVGIALLLTPSPDFFAQSGEKKERLNWGFMLRYLYPYKKLIFQLVVGLGVGSLLQLIIPFLAQSIVDIGINTRNLNFIYIILIAQSILFLGRLSVEFIRSWILLHMSTRLNISILTDFLIKLMKLPMLFFDARMTGDIMQRMNDQRRIESFLTGSTLSTFFSMFNLVIFTFVLLKFNITVFVVFVSATAIYSVWVLAFLKQRRRLDVKRFDISSHNQSKIVQLIGGMQEIKLNNCEQQKRWEWEHIQADLFRFSVKSLSIGQIQQIGAFFINEGKNIVITFLVAKSVIDGDLTLGQMVAIQYIVGQINSPIEQLLGFMQQLQDAKLSLERLNEIHMLEDEQPVTRTFVNELPLDKSISLKNLYFTYPGAGNEPVLKDISFHIPEGKTTAIVGVSGSGKTTILKLLLRFYEPQKGEIRVGKLGIDQIGHRFWRGKCGIVMQDGYVFSENIARNIAVADEYPDKVKLQHAIEVANISDLIEGLPLGLNTKIGMEGNGISQGQKQRILIARSVYKNPEYIFFDEATNSLDANNESIIMKNLEEFFQGKTVVVVAHRLSTVKNADNIIVLEKGVIVEQGNHNALVARRGSYYELIRNQLDLN